MYLAPREPETGLASIRRVWRQILALEQWPIEYRMFFLAIITQQLQNRDEPQQVVLWRFLQKRNLRHLARQYATTAIDRELSWLMVQVWLSHLGAGMPGLQEHFERPLRQRSPLHLAQVRGLYERWDRIIGDFAWNYIDGPWPELHPTATAAIAALQVEVAIFRGLLSGPDATQAADREAFCETVRAVIGIHPGHDPAILHAMMPQSDGVTLSLLLLRL